jgi:predicted nucleic acid-binding protein
VQEKVVFDTNVYIGVFNKGLHKREIDGLKKVMYLAHPVLHELWIGAKSQREVRHLVKFGNTFIRLGRLIKPEPATQILIGKTCRKLRASGKLNPQHPRIYNDVCIALLSRQIGATLVTGDINDFEKIRKAIDFNFREVVSGI